MPHSTLTIKGQTTIPLEIRTALNMKPGDRLEYALESGRATIRVHPGIMAAQGMLKSDKGKGMTFAQIRKAAAAADVRRGARWRPAGS